MLRCARLRGTFCALGSSPSGHPSQHLLRVAAGSATMPSGRCPPGAGGSAPPDPCHRWLALAVGLETASFAGPRRACARSRPGLSSLQRWVDVSAVRSSPGAVSLNKEKE